MKSMNDGVSVGTRIKQKAATIVSDMLIHEAETATEVSIFILIHEPKFPVELLKENAE